MKSKKAIYLCEGDNEEKLVKDLKDVKNKCGCIISPGKVKKVNVATRQLNNSHLKDIDKSTTCFVLVDADIWINKDQELTLFINNCNRLLKYTSKLILVLQWKNFEEELVNSTDNIKTVRELYSDRNCTGATDFKTKFNKMTNIRDWLVGLGFNVSIYGTNHKRYIEQNSLIFDVLKENGLCNFIGTLNS